MELPPTDLSWFAEHLTESVQELLDAWNDNNTSVQQEVNTSPELLQKSLMQLIDLLRVQEWRNNPDPYVEKDVFRAMDVSELGDYGLTLLTELAQLSLDLGLNDSIERLEQLALSLGLWVAKQQGELSNVELVVNGIARLANQTYAEKELESLFFAMGEILDSVSPAISLRYTRNEPMHNPRTLLLINRAIVATRMLSPILMESAFADVVEQHPEVAPGFFSEGMEQVKVQEYPDDVREVIERYYHEYPPAAKLH